MTAENNKFKRYKIQYKIFLAFAILTILDSVILKPLGIPFIASLILYPTFRLVLSHETTVTLLGIYSIFWLLFLIITIVVRKELKKLEKDIKKPVAPENS